MDYTKPQKTLMHNGNGIYPLTTADQVIRSDGSRLEENGKIRADSSADSDKLGGRPPEYYMNPSSAADSKKLGGKDPKYYIETYNFLDNSDFTNPVNQRGFSSYSGAGYTIDRWVNSSSTMSLEQLDGSIKLTSSKEASVFEQRLPSHVTLRLAGKKYTFAVCVDDGSIYCVSGTFPTANEQYDGPNKAIGSSGFIIDLFKQNADSNVTVRIYSNTNESASSISLRWAALYEGEYTAENLPPYKPKGFAAELAECQMYCRIAENVTCVKTAEQNYYAIDRVFYMRARPTYIFHRVDVYGGPSDPITDFTGCLVYSSFNEVNGYYRLAYAVMPTCSAYDAFGFRISMYADL